MKSRSDRASIIPREIGEAQIVYSIPKNRDYTRQSIEIEKFFKKDKNEMFLYDLGFEQWIWGVKNLKSSI